MTRIAGRISNKHSFGANIKTSFEARTLRLEDGTWTPRTDEEGIMNEWSEQNTFMGVTLPSNWVPLEADLTCSCGGPWRFKGQMEFLYEGQYEYTHDAVCPECGARAAITTKALLQ